MDEGESLRGILLWYDLGTSIRPSNFEYLPADEIRRWRNIIRNKGINVPTGRDVKIKTVMIDLLTRSEYPGDIQPSHASKNEGMTPLANAPPEVTSAATSNRGENQGDANTLQAVAAAATGGGDGDDGGDESDDEVSGRRQGNDRRGGRHRNRRRNGGDDGSDGDDSDEEGRHGGGDRGRRRAFREDKFD
jgi:hypothetical protein